MGYKYNTEEERLAAIKRKKREYRERNAEKHKEYMKNYMKEYMKNKYHIENKNARYYNIKTSENEISETTNNIDTKE
jgi:hypothetical protein